MVDFFGTLLVCILAGELPKKIRVWPKDVERTNLPQNLNPGLTSYSKKCKQCYIKKVSPKPGSKYFFSPTVSVWHFFGSVGGWPSWIKSSAGAWRGSAYQSCKASG